MAERVGFEPTIPVKVYTLSKRAPSATRPSLRKKLRGSSHCTAVLQCRLLAEGMFASRPEPVNPQPFAMAAACAYLSTALGSANLFLISSSASLFQCRL